MARDNDTQFLRLHNEFGQVELGTDGTVDVTIRFSHVKSCVATHGADAVVASTLQCSALSSGVITITDSAGKAHSGVTVNYNVCGWA